MDFRILGPLEVWHDGAHVPVTAPMQRAVLATLLVRPGHTVSVDSIVDQLWGPQPPHTAQVTIRNYVQRLRRVLPEPVLETVAPGYRLAVLPDQVDASRFAGLVEQARTVASPNPVRAAQLFDEALHLWRGSPLADLGDVPMRLVHAPRLEELYLGALEESFEVGLRLGWHARLIPELTALTNTYPLRERLCRQLMISLYRTRRSAEALTHYQHIRARMIAELGVEPGPELRRLQESILREDLTLSVPFIRVNAPAERPAADPPPRLATFTGRDAELTELRERFAAPGPVVFFVHGPAGVGKSTLAAQFAHELAARFPDGTLYVDLAGNQPGAPATPAAVLTALLGSPHSSPGSAEAAVRAYRARLRGRRVLVVLDNATSASQVLPAIPDEDGCAAIVTSRRPVAGPDGTVHLHVDALSTKESVDLLGRIVGPRKVDGEPEAAAELAELCANNPLALRTIATRAASRPHWSLAAWVELLTDPGRRRTELADVLGGLRVSVDQLARGGTEAEQTAAELLPRLQHATELTPAAVADLTGWPETLVGQALEELVDAQLLYSPTPGGYAHYGLTALLDTETPATPG
ncbi:AfsR/SARP family transcriptional regulator [Actinophytocola gossypii]|uniref:AAA family ATPase n=1 Tax=Actinophytocola gossypii TaxID=2812003 RepID=A0ABT2JHR1_9PSEU|nr:AfsR/SARP family transcriptional regulator [Actinophytocola gossypii]MCT2587420.1 AAA family ATPase [Actinophytocola gossypii]